MVLLEIVNEPLLLSPFRAVLAFGTFVRLRHELFNPNNGDRLEWSDNIIEDVLSVFFRLVSSWLLI
jgi:hypothetical protein